MRRRSLFAAGVCVAASIAAQPALAVTYEPPPPFCEGGVVHDHLAPLERMPRLHAPNPNGRIGFGPSGMRLRPLPPLVVGPGEAGYTLTLSRPAVRVGWMVATTLSRVDWRGRPVETEAQGRRHVSSIGRGHGAGVRFPLDTQPGVHRITVVFHSRSGRKLGAFGFYFRVVWSSWKARLALDAESYRPGDSVFGRVDNFGTAVVRYGAPYAIERLDGSTWIPAPETPRGAWILILYGAGPGAAGSPCSAFPVPPGMAPGQYRMVKEVSFEDWRKPSKPSPARLTTEFEVLPAS